MIAFNALLPVFGLILLGMLLKRWAQVSEESFSHANGLLYWVAMPSLLFHKFAHLESLDFPVGAFLQVFALATLASLVLGWLVAWGWGLPKVQRGAFAHVGFRGNLAFVGLPIALYLVNATGQTSWEGMILLALSPMIILYNLLGVLVLALHQGEGKPDWLQAGKTIVTNPLILSCGLGVLWRYLDWGIPLSLDRLLAALGQMVVPLSLICVGGAVQRSKGAADTGVVVAAAVIKTLVTPLLGWAIGWGLGLASQQIQVLMIFLAAPTAAAAYILARQMGSDASLTANAVFYGLFFSLGCMTLILVWL